MTPGQMLLMGFSGLFTRLENDFSDMLDAISAVQLPDVWKKVDRVKEAGAIRVYIIRILIFYLIFIFLQSDTHKHRSDFLHTGK